MAFFSDAKLLHSSKCTVLCGPWIRNWKKGKVGEGGLWCRFQDQFLQNLVIVSINCDSNVSVLCSKKRCRKPGEACLLNRYNRPQCACLHVCPRSTARDRVCATDGITYRSACELNRTACILGNTNIKFNYHGKCGQESMWSISLSFIILFCH